MNLLEPRRLDALAREYALGTLTGPARRRFERLLRDSRAAELAVLVWQERLATLARPVPALEPSERVWAGLEQRLFPAAAAAAAPAEPWWRRLLSGRSLGGALAGMLLAVVVLREQPAWIGLEPARETLPASYVGLLHDGAGQPTLLASSRRHGRVLTVKMLKPLAVPAGSVAVLWALPKDGGAPFAVGTVPTQGSVAVALADTSEKLFFNVARLGVSIEPAGGAALPARPGGPFVLSGDCVKLW
jgi:anti-sigma-K factor RskA